MPSRQCAASLDTVRDASAAPCPAHDFGRIPVYDTTPAGSHAWLALNAPGDRGEQEADRVAGEIVRTPAPVVARAGMACGSVGPPCRACKEQGMALSRAARGEAQAAAPASVHAVLGSPGQPLSAATRAFFEPRLLRDLANVRVHTDAAAQQSAREVDALAYTVGSHVVFGAGRHDPGSQEGQYLLAHELAHVVQQAGSQTGWQTRQPMVQRQQAQRPQAEPEPEPETPPDRLDRFLTDPMAILQAMNPYQYCRLNCPATADAFENFVRTGRVDEAHCDRDAELSGTIGYQINDRFAPGRFNITSDRRGRRSGLDRFLRTIARRLPNHGDVAVVEAERTRAQREELSRYHYFVIVNIRGARFAVDAYLRQVHPPAAFRDYLDALDVTFLRYVTAPFRAVPRIRDTGR